MNGDPTYHGPDRRASDTDVRSLGEKVVGLTKEAVSIRDQMARERFWRKLTLIYVSASAMIAVASLAVSIGVLALALSNRSTIQAVAGPEAQARQAVQMANIICDLKIDNHLANGVPLPPCAATTTMPPVSVPR